jgi:hypothetical protein
MNDSDPLPVRNKKKEGTGFGSLSAKYRSIGHPLQYLQNKTRFISVFIDRFDALIISRYRHLTLNHFFLNFNLTIMTAIMLNQVADSARTLADLVIDFDPSKCSEDELGELIRLGEKLEGIGVTLLSKAESKYAWEASAGLRFKVAATTSKVIAREEVLLPARFRRSIKAIFIGPESLLQSQSLWHKRRNNFEQRCKRLRKLSPSAIITWALTFSPNSWLVHNMRNDIFSCLITFVESQPPKMWPSKVYELLEALQKDIDFAQSLHYIRFVSGKCHEAYSGQSLRQSTKLGDRFKP